MNGSAPRIPDPKELEREISEFLSKKFGGHVKVLSPVVMAEESPAAVTPETPRRKTRVDFNLKPEELIAYLDQYVVRQDQAKAILATKICTHFNRIRRAQENPGPLETAPGGHQEQRADDRPHGRRQNLYHQADRLQDRGAVRQGRRHQVQRDRLRRRRRGGPGAGPGPRGRRRHRTGRSTGSSTSTRSTRSPRRDNLVGADVSRTGVQRALLKPMEETDVDLKVPHDPVSHDAGNRAVPQNGQARKAGLGQHQKHALHHERGVRRPGADHPTTAVKPGDRIRCAAHERAGAGRYPARTSRPRI